MRFLTLALLLLIFSCSENKNADNINKKKISKDTIISISKNIDTVKIDTITDTLNNAIDNYDDVPQSIDEILLSKIITKYFSLDPSCLFQSNEQDKSIKIFESNYQVYVTGPIQLIEGYHRCCSDKIPGLSSVFDWALDSTKEKLEKFSFKPIKTLSGITPCTSKEKFSHINPKIVRWGVKNLIPNPNIKIGETTLQDIYNTTFLSFFRNLYQSLKWLEESDNKIKNNYQEYRDSVINGSNWFNAASFFNKKYADVNFENIDDICGFSEPEAIGFWLRRYWDGSLPELKKGLIKLLEIYDREIIYGLEENQYSKIIPKDSLKGLALYYPGLTINFPNINMICDYNADSIAKLDTFKIEWSDAFGCGYGEFDSINIFKNQNIIDIELFHQGTKSYFFNDDGSGGVWTDDRIEIISSEVDQIYAKTDTTYIVNDIFKLEYSWKKEYSFEHSEISDKIVAEQEFRTSMILPHTYNFILEWTSKIDESKDYNNFKKVITIEFVHGD